MGVSRKSKPVKTTVSEPSSAIPMRRFLDSPWAPVLYFLVFAMVYFSGFVFSDSVLLGLDTGTDFHLGKEPFWEKAAELVPPNWSRHQGGTPQTGQRLMNYFPLHIISLFTSVHRYLGWRYFFAVFSAGYFAYLCIRGFGLRPATAILIGTAYASMPTLLTFVYPGQEAKMLVIGLFPLMVWGLHGIIATGHWAHVLLLSAGVGAAVYTPHLQMLYYSLIGLGLLFLVETTARALKERDSRWVLRRYALSAGAILLGLTIGSVGFVPQYYYTKTESRRAGEDGEGVGIDYAQSWSLHPEEIASLVVPEFAHFDTQNSHSYWGRNIFKLNSEYFGMVPLFFACVGLGTIRKRRWALAFVVLLLFSVTFSLGPHTPVHRLCYEFVPGMRVLRAPGMIAFLFAFSACGLAAFGVERILYASSPQPVLLKRLTVGAAIAVIVLLSSAVFPRIWTESWTSLFWSDIPADKAQKALANVPSFGRAAMLAALLIAALYGITRQRLRGKVSIGLFVVVVVAVVIVDTWRVGKQFLVHVDPDRHPSAEQLYPNLIEFLGKDQGLYRAFALSPLQPAIPDLDLVTVPHHEPFTVARYDRITGQENLNLATLSLLNAKYLVSPNPLQVAGLREALRADGLWVYENLHALPWFYTAAEYLVEPDEDAALSRLVAAELDPRTKVIVESQPVGLGGTMSGNVASDRIERLAYDPRAGRIDLLVETDGPRLLVVSENYHPFWTATVDGVSRPVIRANYVWKAVPLDAGRHQVSLRYHDPIAAVCRWLSLLGVGTWLAAAGVWLTRRHRASNRVSYSG